MENKWYVVVTNLAGNCILDEFQVGIVADYDLDESTVEIISKHDSEELAAAACTQYAKENGIPEFGTLVMVSMACPKCGNREMDELIMDDDDYCRCGKCGTIYDPLEK